MGNIEGIVQCCASATSLQIKFKTNKKLHASKGKVCITFIPVGSKLTVLVCGDKLSIIVKCSMKNPVQCAPEGKANKIIGGTKDGESSGLHHLVLVTSPQENIAGLERS